MSLCVFVCECIGYIHRRGDTGDDQRVEQNGSWSLFCIAEGQPVSLANGTSQPIEQVVSGSNVLARGQVDDGDGMEVRKVTATSKNKKACIELIFADGRTLVCTPDHRILTADKQWVQAQNLVIGQSNVAVTVDYPAFDLQAETDSKWTLVTSMGTLSAAAESRHSVQAFARLLGYVLSDGTVGTVAPDGHVNTSEVYPGHRLDVDMVLADVEILTNKRPTFSKKNTTYRVALPMELHLAYQSIGITVGKRADVIQHLPAFVTDPGCPVFVVREFLGGLFGGDGICSTLKHAKKGSFSQLGFCMTKTGRIVQTQVDIMKAEFLPLLQRAGLDPETINISFGVAPPCQLTETGRALTAQLKKDGKPISRTFKDGDDIHSDVSYRITVYLGTGNTTAFASNIGFRYCVHKQVRLAAVAACSRAQKFVQQQYSELAVATRNLIKSGGYTARKASVKAKADFIKTQVLHPSLASWEPTGPSGITDTIRAFQVHEIVKQFDLSKFFSEKRTRKRYSASHAAAANAASSDCSAADGIDEDEGSPMQIDTPEVPSDKVRWGVHVDARVIPTFQVPLIGKRDAGMRNVYDLTVPSKCGDDFASFVVNGLVVHNCPNEAPGLAESHSEAFEKLYIQYEQTPGKARKVMKARDLWKQITDVQTETGVPYMLFKDACNSKSNQQNLVRHNIHASHQCVN